jgi:ElaB/YqjD/DUF883 family membrane-anchored ribosome-binding protein
LSDYVRSQLDKAATRLAKNDYRRALTELGHAYWNLSQTDSEEDFDRLEQLLSQTAAGASGRTAEKATKLQQAAQEEIKRRRLAAATQRPSHPTATVEDSFLGLGAWLGLGAVCGLVIGFIFGALVAASGPPNTEGPTGAVVPLCAAIGAIIGLVLGLMVGMIKREASRAGP